MKQGFRDWFDRTYPGQGKLLFWIALCLMSLFLLGHRAAHASEPVLRVHAPSGDQWICHPRDKQLICNTDPTVSPPQSITPDRDLQTSALLPNAPGLFPLPTGTVMLPQRPVMDFLLKLLVIGLPVGGGVFCLGQGLKARYRKARMKSFVEQLERIWQQSAQH